VRVVVVRLVGEAERLSREAEGGERESKEELRRCDEPRLDSRPRLKLLGNKRPSNPDIIAAIAFRPGVFFFDPVCSDEIVDTSDLASSSIPDPRAVEA
jgi:hypothetical protein